MKDVIKNTVISQYANSPIMLQLIEYWNQDIDPSIDIENFYNFVFNLETAQGFGLDIWGRILGVSRYVYAVANNQYFGFYNSTFSDANQVYTPFNVKPFFNGYDYTPTIPVDDTNYRKMLFCKAYANINAATIPTINFILNFLLEGQNSGYVIDNLDMTMQYHFNVQLTPVQFAIIYQSGIVPVPAGVKVIG